MTSDAIDLTDLGAVPATQSDNNYDLSDLAASSNAQSVPSVSVPEKSPVVEPENKILAGVKKAYQTVTTPIGQLLPEKYRINDITSLIPGTMLRRDIIDYLSKQEGTTGIAGQVAKGLEDVATENINAATSPVGLAMVYENIPATASRIASGLFSAQALANIPEAFRQVQSAQGIAPTIQAGGALAGDIAQAAFGGVHALRKGAKPPASELPPLPEVKPPVEPAIQFQTPIAPEAFQVSTPSGLSMAAETAPRPVSGEIKATPELLALLDQQNPSVPEQFSRVETARPIFDNEKLVGEIRPTRRLEAMAQEGGTVVPSSGSVIVTPRSGRFLVDERGSVLEVNDANNPSQREVALIKQQAVLPENAIPLSERINEAANNTIYVDENGRAKIGPVEDAKDRPKIDLTLAEKANLEREADRQIEQEYLLQAQLQMQEPEVSRKVINKSLPSRRKIPLKESKQIATQFQQRVPSEQARGETEFNRPANQQIGTETPALIAPENTPAIPPEKPTAQGILSGLETWADGVIKEGKKRVSMGLDPELLAAYAVKGAALIEKGIISGSEWTSKMVSEFGDKVKPHLQLIRKHAENIRSESFKRTIAETTQSKPVAPAKFFKTQENLKGEPVFGLYNLTEDIPGHPKGSTVSDRTLLNAGYSLPEKAPAPESTALPELPKVQTQRIQKSYTQLDKAKEGVVNLFKSRPTEKRIVATFEGADTQAKNFGRQILNEVKLLIPSAADRKAATFIIEANGDKNRLNTFLEQSLKNKEATDSIALAIRDYERLKPLADKVESITGKQLAEEHAAGIDTDEFSGYVKHAYDQDVFLGKGRPVILGKPTGTGVSSAFRKERVFKDYASAIKAGYEPQSLDIADLTESRVRAGQRMINRRNWIKSFQEVQNPIDGRPVVIEPSTQPGGKQVVPVGYTIMEPLPGIRLGVHDAFVNVIRDITGEGWGGLIAKAALRFEGEIKHGTLLFDTFHASRIMQKQLALTRQKPSWNKGLSILEYGDKMLDSAVSQKLISKEMADYARKNRPVADLLMKEGLNVGRITENLWNDVSKPLVEKLLGEKVGGFIHGVNKFVFDKVTRGAMLESALIEFERQKKSNPALSDREIAARVARDINVYFGNVGKQGIFRNQKMQELANLAFLAPSWIESMARSELGAYKQGASLASDIARGRAYTVGTLARGMGSGLLAYAVGSQIINLVTRGQFTWDNKEEGHKLDAWIPDFSGKTDGYFVSPFSVVADLTHDMLRYHHSEGTWLKAGSRVLSNKFSPMTRATAMLLFGKDFFGRTQNADMDRIARAGAMLVPVPLAAGSIVTGEKYPGEGQRKVMGSFGIKAELVPTKVSQIYDKANRFIEEQGSPKAKANLERKKAEGIQESDYRDLKNALISGDMKAAQEEYQKLITEKGKKPFLITDYFQSVDRPFTGSSVEEGKFKRSLNQDDRQLYDEARAERKKLLAKYKAFKQQLLK